MRLEWGILFRPPSIWTGIIFTSKVYQWGIFFTQKVYEWVKFEKIVYEWGQFSKIVYEWGQFSIWEVYEWVMFFTWPGIWMGWGSGTPAAHPYPKSWQVTPPPPPCLAISNWHVGSGFPYYTGECAEKSGWFSVTFRFVGSHLPAYPVQLHIAGKTNYKKDCFTIKISSVNQLNCRCCRSLSQIVRHNFLKTPLFSDDILRVRQKAFAKKK